jgi:hypothetical protein
MRRNAKWRLIIRTTRVYVYWPVRMTDCDHQTRNVIHIVKSDLLQSEKREREVILFPVIVVFMDWLSSRKKEKSSGLRRLLPSAEISSYFRPAKKSSHYRSDFIPRQRAFPSLWPLAWLKIIPRNNKKYLMDFCRKH